MITESQRKILKELKNEGESLTRLIRYVLGEIPEKENNIEQIIIKEMKKLGYKERDIVECMEYDFALDMSWHPMSVKYGKG